VGSGEAKAPRFMEFGGISYLIGWVTRPEARDRSGQDLVGLTLSQSLGPQDFSSFLSLASRQPVPDMPVKNPGKCITFVGQQVAATRMKLLDWAFFGGIIITMVFGCGRSAPQGEAATLPADSLTEAPSFDTKPDGETAPRVPGRLGASGSAMRKGEHATRGDIRIAVDQTLAPVIGAIVDNFTTIYPEAKITPIYLPGEEAIQRMLDSDSLRLVISTRRLSRDEEAYLRQQQVHPNYAVIGRDAIVVVTAEGNPTRRLTLDQLQAILTGQITRWDEIDPANGLGAISLVFDHAQSSTARYLQDSLLAGADFRQGGVFAAGSTAAMMREVANRPGALGLGGWAWVSDRDEPSRDSLMQGLGIVLLEGRKDNTECRYKQRFFGPHQSFTYWRCYPLTRTMTVISRETIFGLGTGLTSYIDSPPGQRIIHKAGLTAIHDIPRRVRMPAKEGAQQIE